MRSGVRNQKGITLLNVALAIAVGSIAFLAYLTYLQENIEDQGYEIQAKQLAEVANAVVRYQSSGGDVATGVLSPADQAGVAGQPFQNGRTHIGLDWLKESSCSAGASAPFGLLDCNYPNTPSIGDSSQYRFTISNNGTDIVTTLSIRNTANTAQGIVENGKVDETVADIISAKAESKVSFSSAGAVNTFFRRLPNAIVQIQIGLDIANMPYVRRDGRVTHTGTQHYENNAGIVFDTPADVTGVQNMSAERFADYDRTTNTVSTSRYIEPAGNSFIENIDFQSGKAKSFDSTDITATNVDADNVRIKFITQTDASLQNRFAGEVRVGNATDNTLISDGNILTSGNIYNSNDQAYLMDLDGTSRIKDLVVADANEAKLSERLGNFVQKGVVVAQANSLIPQPDCGTAGSPRLILVPTAWSTYFLDNGNITINNNHYSLDATVVGANWRVNMKTYRPSDQSLIDDPNGSALANIFCYFP